MNFRNYDRNCGSFREKRLLHTFDTHVFYTRLSGNTRRDTSNVIVLGTGFAVVAAWASALIDTRLLVSYCCYVGKAAQVAFPQRDRFTCLVTWFSSISEPRFCKYVTHLNSWETWKITITPDTVTYVHACIFRNGASSISSC